MGRSGGWRDEAASALVLRHLAGLDPARSALVMEDPRRDVLEALRAGGVDAAAWNRRASGGRAASEWPPAGQWDTVFLRLPRAKEELEMLAHAAAARLRPDGRLLLYGAKDEGAGSAGRRLEAVFDLVRSVATGGRCRLVEAGRPDASRARGRPDDWRATYRLPLPELTDRPWVSYPGVFAHGRLDEGTALLLDALPPVPSGGRVLDFGCGDGVVGATVAARADGVDPDLLDVDALALRAARENVPRGRTLLGEGIGATPPVSYDLIVANPPFHAGKKETLDVIRDLIGGAPERLSRHGRVVMVVQRRLPVEEELRRVFERVELRADRGPFRVWEGAP